jgi:hypothetical protein
MFAVSARQIAVSMLGASLVATAVPASAAAVLRTTQTNDAAFEGPGGWLQTTFGLPLVSGTALPPIERAVGQVKTGVNRRRGLHVPTSATGLPAPDGTGVTQALTNVAAVGSSDTTFEKLSPVAFTFARVGNTISYTVGDDPTWSQTKGYFADINSFELRIRGGNVDSVGPLHSINGLTFNDAITTNQLLGDFSAGDGAVLIKLWSNVQGDFSLTGNYVFDWAGTTAPGGSQLASQLKLLALPAIPEPATWAMLIAGFGLTGAAMRRRRAAIA